jgi:Myb-like DNA-binding domain
MLYKGRWSKAEEDKLREIVSEMRDAGVGNAFWIEVSKKMGRTRSRQQCSEKWYIPLLFFLPNDTYRLDRASLLRDPKLAAGSETLIWKCLNLKDFESYQD